MVKSEEEYQSFELFGLEFPIYKSLLIKSTLISWIVLLSILAVALGLFQYELTNADIPCGALAGVLLGYLATLIVNW
jgi:hypothetical protein